jgi:Clp amino terminal domain, pathogenicity island component
MIGRTARGDVLRGALAEARLRGDRRVGTEHLLLGLLRHPETAAAQAIGVDLFAARRALATLDAEALALIGIDVAATPLAADAPTSADEAAPLGLCGFEPPRQPGPPTPEQVARLRAALSSGARAVLSRAVVEGPGPPQPGKPRPPTPETILAALLAREPPDPAAALLARLGVDRARTLDLLGEWAS